MLAAGQGTRLAGVTDTPKWLLPLDGACPATAQLMGMERARVGRVLVVVGASSSRIEEFVAPWRDRLDLSLVENEHASRWNNWYSLLLGLQACPGDGGRGVAAINSDLYADAAWFATLIESVRSCGGPAALAVDRDRGRSAEAMKVALDASRRRVTAIGKAGVEPPSGEYVGLSWWSRQSASELAAVLGEFLHEPAQADSWYEQGIDRHLHRGGHYLAVDVPDGLWVEIDDEHDLAAASQLRLQRAPGP